MSFEVGKVTEMIDMEKAQTVPEIGKPGDAVIFANRGHVLVRPGRRYYTLICSDGQDQLCIRLPIEQAQAMLLALEVNLFPEVHSPQK